MTGPLLFSWELKKCDAPDCRRAVKTGVLFCCAPCSAAAASKYEIHAHSEGCDERAAERGDHWSVLVRDGGRPARVR